MLDMIEVFWDGKGVYLGLLIARSMYGIWDEEGVHLRAIC